jgi:hypothetical protein
VVEAPTSGNSQFGQHLSSGGHVMPDKTEGKGVPRADRAQLRAIFGANLRTLSASATSIAGLCRDLGINRTQFNRYLVGEAFPRPDVLDQICRFFGVDARILLEPLEVLSGGAELDYGLLGLEQNSAGSTGSTGHNEAAPAIDYARIPLGTSLLYRRSFLNNGLLSVCMTSTVVRPDGKIGLTSIIPRDVTQALGLSLRLKDRRRIGELYQHPTGVSFVFKDQVSGIWQFAFMEYSYLGNSNLYAGECMNTLRLGHPGRISDLILMERLEPTRAAILAARRQIGYKYISDMKPVVQGYFTQAEV